ncbi:hypothetical protein WN55_08996 [Dufourea novaeangliae]|uniref:Uncharacterized protein n=1 Tax=Dufourea novaeangliae TaxID=178035 RepID=A0A154P688_DUFNO|nr:hypothetical protein WN55_08996 [Dufourea novaeangliae]
MSKGRVFRADNGSEGIECLPTVPGPRVLNICRSQAVSKIRKSLLYGHQPVFLTMRDTIEKYSLPGKERSRGNGK